MSNKIKILFIGNLNSSFIRKDFELLKKHFNVRAVDLNREKSLINILRVVFESFRGTLWANITFTWFAGTHAFSSVLLSKLLRKKSIVVVGGYEVAKVPEINYGGITNPKKSRLIKFLLKNADKILAVSKNNKNEILRWVERDVELIYHYIDYDKFRTTGDKENIAITVGGINKLTLKKKGIENFVKSAKFLPNIPFVVIGRSLDGSVEHLRAIATENVSFTGFIPENELIDWYQKSKVYCQLSLHESFGLSLAESMACECIPVVTDEGAIPEVVGDTGFYVPYDDPKATAEAIKKALNSDKGEEARERIKKMFSVEEREKELVRIIKT